MKQIRALLSIKVEKPLDFTQIATRNAAPLSNLGMKVSRPLCFEILLLPTPMSPFLAQISHGILILHYSVHVVIESSVNKFARKLLYSCRKIRSGRRVFRLPFDSLLLCVAGSYLAGVPYANITCYVHAYTLIPFNKFSWFCDVLEMY